MNNTADRRQSEKLYKNIYWSGSISQVFHFRLSVVNKNAQAC